MLNRIVNLIFLNTAYMKESIAIASGIAGRVYEERYRKAVNSRLEEERKALVYNDPAL